MSQRPTEHDIWALAYHLGSTLTAPPSIQKPTWLEAPLGRYVADPFLVKRDGVMWVFFEDYDLQSGVGHIGASPLESFESRPALCLPWHLSYPFLIETDGELFCVPEQHQANKVSLYRCTEFPGRWVEEAVIIEGFAGVDPTLIWEAGYWWMWVGEETRQAKHRTFLFYAKELTGPWHEHRLSPAIERHNLARPGGKPWQTDGRWVRPVQNRERTYGGGMALFSVETLNPDEYRETELLRWEPHQRWPFPDGLHHLCHLDDVTIWDAKRIDSS